MWKNATSKISNGYSEKGTDTLDEYDGLTKHLTVSSVTKSEKQAVTVDWLTELFSVVITILFSTEISSVFIVLDNAGAIRQDINPNTIRNWGIKLENRRLSNINI